MLRGGWFLVGLIGTVIAALCCFTPAATIALGLMGLGIYANWLDLVFLPALILFAGICIWSIVCRDAKA